MRQARPALAALAAALLLAGCASTTRIGDLLDDPGRYDGRTVRVKGEVRESIGGFGRGAYRLSDGTGTLNVVNQSGGAPREGARVGVEGTFRSVFTFGDRTEAVLLERDRFDP
jgi:hypothetical protein